MALMALLMLAPQPWIAAQDSASPEREQVLAVLEQLQQTVDAQMTGGYSGRLIAEEDINGELFRKDMQVWFRRTPRAVHFVFNSPDEGQTVTWQEGWEEINVNPPGLVPEIGLDPTGERAMATSHRPVTVFGIDLALDRYLEAVRSAPEDGEFSYENAGVEPMAGRELERHNFTHPEVAGNPVTSISIWVDPATGMPVCFEHRRADGSVYERYRYPQFELNPTFEEGLFD
jgi:hypothetical protein